MEERPLSSCGHDFHVVLINTDLLTQLYPGMPLPERRWLYLWSQWRVPFMRFACRKLDRDFVAVYYY